MFCKSVISITTAIFMISSAFAQESVMRSPMQKATYGKWSSFRFVVKNDGNSPMIFTTAYQPQETDECFPGYPLKPLMPGKSVTIDVLCQFHFVHEESRMLRIKQVPLQVTTASGRSRLSLQVEAQVASTRMKPTQDHALNTNTSDAQTGNAHFILVNSAETPRATFYATNCDEINSRMSEISALKEKLDHKKEPLPACTCRDHPYAQNLKCSAVADSVLTASMKGELNYTPACNGPNCWNTSLRLAQLIPNARYTTETEMKMWLSSPLCKELPLDQKPAPGDIIAIRDSEGTEVHGFTYVGPDLVYTKNGFNKTNPYRFMVPGDVFETYGVSPACQRVAQKTALKTCAKQMSAQYFHCTSYDEFEAEAFKKNPRLKKLAAETRQIDRTVSIAAFQGCPGGKAFTNAQSDWLAQTAANIFQTSKEVKAENADEAVVLKTLIERSRSIYHQMEQLEEN